MLITSSPLKISALLKYFICIYRKLKLMFSRLYICLMFICELEMELFITPVELRQRTRMPKHCKMDISVYKYLKIVLKCLRLFALISGDLLSL